MGNLVDGERPLLPNFPIFFTTHERPVFGIIVIILKIGKNNRCVYSLYAIFCCFILHGVLVGGSSKQFIECRFNIHTSWAL